MSCFQGVPDLMQTFQFIFCVGILKKIDLVLALQGALLTILVNRRREEGVEKGLSFVIYKSASKDL